MMMTISVVIVIPIQMSIGSRVEIKFIGIPIARLIVMIVIVIRRRRRSGFHEVMWSVIPIISIDKRANHKERK